MKTSPPVTLLSMRRDETGYISEVSGSPDLQTKMRAMGLYSGRRIVKRSAEKSGGPVLVEVMGTRVALGRGMAAKVSVKVKSRAILLAGNPNVGKSVVFSRLTGLEVISSNYPGTTVEYTAGHTMLAGERFSVIDVPGAYSHAPTNKAEEVARSILTAGGAALILNVVDATSLERNLFYTLELAAMGTPLVILLNKQDIARRKGVDIDAAALERHLGIRVVPFVATTGEGLAALQQAVRDFNEGRLPPPAEVPAGPDEKWKLIGRVSAECQRISHKHATVLEKLEDLTSRPSTGLPFAAAVMLGLFLAIRFVGEGLINRVLDPLFNSVWMPLLNSALSGLQDGGFLKLLLLGSTPKPMESFGLLTTGLYIPFVTVLPYIVAFYTALSLLEDIGYLPRLAVLLDSSMHRLGLHGYGTIPLMLGLGCKVPAILAARVLETPRERVIATALTLALAPCMPQTAMILSLLAPYSIKYTVAVFGAVAAAGMLSSALLSRMLKGETPELFLEIPPLPDPLRLHTRPQGIFPPEGLPAGGGPDDSGRRARREPAGHERGAGGHLRFLQAGGHGPAGPAPGDGLRHGAGLPAQGRFHSDAVAFRALPRVHSGGQRLPEPVPALPRQLHGDAARAGPAGRRQGLRDELRRRAALRGAFEPRRKNHMIYTRGGRVPSLA